MFIDRVKIWCRAGDGGNGCIAWRREKFIPKGGPTGGNGGKGASVVFQADHNVYSLDWFSYKHELKAPTGGAGQGACKQGKNGADLIVRIPCGTLLKDAATGEILADFTESGQSYTVCKGGKGGRGNFSFRSSTNRAPNICTPGTDGEEKEVELELKLIADVGFVGLPNAGKSTLIKQLARVRVKIGAYPFTTLTPNLGYLHIEGGHKLLLADIPGLLEGAHLNKGLGIEFLRHIERTKALIYVIDASEFEGRTAIADFETLRNELGAYDKALLEKPFVIVLNKCDVEESEAAVKAFKKKFTKFKKQIISISAEQGTGCKELTEALKEICFEQK